MDTADKFAVRFVTMFAVLLWQLLGLAIVSMIFGNPTAINGVIGCGFTAPLCTLSAVPCKKGAHTFRSRTRFSM
jgi:hypothetical protein